MANLMLSVLGAFAEFERDLIKERQREGIALARQRGAYRGRKTALPAEKAAELGRRVEAGEKKSRLAREFGISRETLYQYLRAGIARKRPGMAHDAMRRGRAAVGVPVPPGGSYEPYSRGRFP